jgi:hypothetical protein
MLILVFLIIVTSVMYTTNRDERKAVLRDVENLASILGWIYASDKLLAWAAMWHGFKDLSSNNLRFTLAQQA